MNEPGNVRLHAVVEGIVQGVGFRQYTEWHAQRLGLCGWVMNRRDRKVEVVAEGPRAMLDELLKLLHKGPRVAMVVRVDTVWEEPTGEFATFVIE